eukprot:46069-Pleurochrysis_carterae.AAC.2
MDDAEPASRAADGPDGGDGAEIGSRVEHEASCADDAGEHSPLAKASDAEGGGEEDDSHTATTIHDHCPR